MGLLPEPTNLQPMKSLHFIISGEFITTIVRDALMGHRLTFAYEIFESMKPTPTKDQMQDILLGDAEFIGASICDDPECEQCEGLEQITLVQRENLEYKEGLKSHRAYIKKAFIEVDGDTILKKETFQSITRSQRKVDRIKEIRTQEHWKDNLTLKRKLTEAQDELDKEYDNLYSQFGLHRKEDYAIGSQQWKQKLRVDGLLEIVKAKMKSSKEIKKLFKDAELEGEQDASFDKLMNRLEMALSRENDA